MTWARSQQAMTVNASKWRDAMRHEKVPDGAEVKLVPEPTNRYDPEAIQIQVNGELWNYVSNQPKDRGTKSRLLGLLNEDRVTHVFVSKYDEYAGGFRIAQIEVMYRQGSKRTNEEAGLRQMFTNLSIKF